jgi:hypothetical protein
VTLLPAKEPPTLTVILIVPAACAGAVKVIVVAVTPVTDAAGTRAPLKITWVFAAAPNPRPVMVIVLPP